MKETFVKQKHDKLQVTKQRYDSHTRRLKEEKNGHEQRLKEASAKEEQLMLRL